MKKTTNRKNKLHCRDDLYVLPHITSGKHVINYIVISKMYFPIGKNFMLRDCVPD
jgi:hypothetical protein